MRLSPPKPDCCVEAGADHQHLVAERAQRGDQFLDMHALAVARLDAVAVEDAHGSRRRRAAARGRGRAAWRAEHGEPARAPRIGQHHADALAPLRRPQPLVGVVAAAEIQLVDALRSQHLAAASAGQHRARRELP